MSDPVVDKIQKNPKYLELRSKRNSLGWGLTILMMVVYYGYIALIAFNKPFLAQPIGSGVTTLGIPIGMGVIVFTILITAMPMGMPSVVTPEPMGWARKGLLKAISAM